MMKSAHDPPITLSVVIPCYNEARTLAACLDRVFAIQDETLRLEVIVVDDASSDGSAAVAEHCAEMNPGITLLHHSTNQGKGAALRTGIRHATGDLVALPMTLLQAKAAACIAGLVLLFCGMRYLAFPEASTGSWNSQLRR